MLRQASEDGKAIFLEGILFAAVLIASIFFGGVYAWTLMLACSLLFVAAIIYPEALFEAKNWPPLLSFSALIIPIVLLIQTILTSVNRHATIESFLKWIAFYIAFALFRYLSKKAVVRFLVLMSGLCLLQSMYGIFQVASGMEKVLWKTKVVYLGLVTGTYINHNHFAGFMELQLGLLIGLVVFFWNQKRVKEALVFLMIFCFSTVALAQSGSRMGLICFLASLCLFLFLGLLSSRKMPRFLFLLAAVIGVSLYAARNTILLRFIDVEGMQASLGGRWMVWKDAIKIVFHYPLLGIGLGAFPWIIPHYQSAELMMGWSHAHNDYLELMAEIGIPAFFVLMMLAIGFICKLVKIVFVNRFNEGFIIWGILIGLFSFGLHGLSDFNFAIPANHLCFVVLLAAANRLSDLNVQTSGDS
jgi:O-antigen ligase